MLEKEVDEKYYLSNIQLNHIQNTKYESMGIERVKDINEETINTITTMGGGNREPKIKEMVFKSKDKRLPEMLDKIDFNSTEPQSLDLYNRTVSDISQTLTMPNHNAQAIVVPEDTTQGFALAYDGDGIYINRPEQKRGVVQKQMIQTIKTQNNDVGVVVVDNIRNNGTSQSGNIYDKEQLSPTLCATDYKNPPKVVNQLRIRKLTPKECYRLMGFGDVAFNLAAPNQSNSSLYHQAGDSIVVNVLEALFKELL
jgi:DNA (cytosine-5)-methyltransferase 1